jgi:hypothetical protein
MSSLAAGVMAKSRGICHPWCHHRASVLLAAHFAFFVPLAELAEIVQGDYDPPVGSTQKQNVYVMRHKLMEPMT